MNIGGIQVTNCEELLVLPRANGKDIPIRAKAVSIHEDFEKMVPMPTPPLIQKKGGNVSDLEDKDFKKAMKRRSDQRFAYLCIRSLEPSNIEWEVVDVENPATWLKWTDELLAAGLSENECNRIVGAVLAANSLDEEKIEEARKAFLLGQGE